VRKKAVQLWNVGHGLPLDAIKSGSIESWKCQYEISDQEVVSLVDALGKNDSLVNLDLSLAGLEWMPPVKREERSAISTLLAKMGDAKALEALEKMIISRTTTWQIPVLALRSGPEKVCTNASRPRMAHAERFCARTRHAVDAPKRACRRSRRWRRLPF
jgi:hypothetical protein